MSRRVRHFLNALVANGVAGQIAVRQLTELQRQVLSLYALLATNACALAFTHYALAPAKLTIWVPCIFVAICAVRALHWWRLLPATFTEREAVRHLRFTSLFTILLSIAFVSWAMAIDAYGGPYEHGHVAIFVAITVIACIFCLTHLPIAALIVTGIVIGVFLFHCLVSGNSVFVAIALNTAFVTIVMVRVLANNFVAFIQLIESQGKTERLLAENSRLALTDSLTDLPNRRFFFQALKAQIAKSQRDEQIFALVIFDLDRFKPVNDTYGHIVGDRVLSETGRRLQTFAGDGVTIARLGGDEFGMLIHAPKSAADAIDFCDGICAALHAPVPLGATPIVTGCSGGVALYPSAGRTAEELFDRADYALYHSKEHRRGVATLFSQEHEDAIRAERAVEAALRSADLAAEMEIHYQPILDVDTNCIVMVEGLARWTHPTLGRIPPDRFIAAAERCGMIHSVTILLLQKTLADAGRLPAEIGLSFNLSAHDLASAETVLSVIAVVRRSGFDPKRLTIELTETALMRDFERAKASITTLRALGIKIALDDFGTGYSSLGYVHRLPLDKIKIDRSFMADIGSELGRRLVTTILDLCHNLGLDGIAEGIETREQLVAVRRHGCRYIQGHLIGAPMPIDDLLAWLPSPARTSGELRHA